MRAGTAAPAGAQPRGTTKWLAPEGPREEGRGARRPAPAGALASPSAPVSRASGPRSRRLPHPTAREGHDASDRWRANWSAGGPVARPGRASTKRWGAPSRLHLGRPAGLLYLHSLSHAVCALPPPRPALPGPPSRRETDCHERCRRCRRLAEQPAAGERVERERAREQKKRPAAGLEIEAPCLRQQLAPPARSRPARPVSAPIFTWESDLTVLPTQCWG